MDPVRCFMLVGTKEGAVGLRRHSPWGQRTAYTCDQGWHDAVRWLPTRGKVVWTRHRDPDHRTYHITHPRYPHTDKRWPTTCDKCTYRFTKSDEWQVATSRLWQRSDTEELIRLQDAPPGAIYDADWLHDRIVGPDGLSLCAVCPGGFTWFIDGQASNCTIKDDYTQKRHHCWIRHGVPPDLTVDKNGPTCQAGAGSIQTGNWHGFLRAGHFVE